MRVTSQDPQISTFEDFYERERGNLFAALILITRHRQEAEEVMQDAFLRMLERWARVSRLEDPVGYLYRTAVNLHRSRLRRVATALRRTIPAPDPNDALERIEAQDIIFRALGELTRREREAVVLVDLFDLPSDEAALMLGIRASTVRVLVSRGRERMKNTLGGRNA